MKYTMTKNGINIIKKDFGVTFDLDEYKKLSKETSPTQALTTMFMDLYKQMVLKDLIIPAADPKSQRFIEFYNQFIVGNVDFDLRAAGKQGLAKNLGLDKMQQFQFMKAIRHDMEEQNNVDVIASNYLKGNIRIRDMVAFAKNIGDLGGLGKPENRTILASYSLALKKVNESRGYWWRKLHPFRNSAEAREAKAIDKILKNGTQERTYNLAISSAKSTLLAHAEIEKETSLAVLGVEDPSKYVPEKEYTEDELTNMMIDEWIKKYQGKGLIAFQQESNEENLQVDENKKLEEDANLREPAGVKKEEIDGKNDAPVQPFNNDGLEESVVLSEGSELY